MARASGSWPRGWKKATSAGRRSPIRKSPNSSSRPQAWRCIAEEVSEQLDYQPGKFSLRRLIRRKYVRLADKAAPPVIAPLPARLQDGCLATSALIAEILVNKYAWSLPLYRQESMFRQRHGLAIPRQTMMNWEALAADRLMPLYQLIKRGLLEAGCLQVDETPVRYQQPGHGKIKTGYYWVYRSADGTVLHDWRSGRSYRRRTNIVPAILS